MLLDGRFKKHAHRVLKKVDSILRKAHGTTSLGNLPDPLDELIFIQMTVRTRNKFSSDLYQQLYKKVGGNWEKILTIPRRQLEGMLRPAGMAKIKASRFQQIISVIKKEFGNVSLMPLKSMSNEQAENFLLCLPGVGPKVARCVLLYSLDRKVFPVDTNCRRVMRRLGLLPSGIDDKKSHNFLQALVPPAIRYTLHVNLIHHGNSYCRPQNPLCGICPIIHLCPTGKGKDKNNNPFCRKRRSH